MHDIVILYNRPQDPAAFDAHYISTHLPLVDKLPGLQEATWGKAESDSLQDYYLVARLTYSSKEDADRSLSSPAGVASVEDLANFAQAGATVLNVPRGTRG
jgi:uncharacterized protein (TIGR02118 family)